MSKEDLETLRFTAVFLFWQRCVSPTGGYIITKGVEGKTFWQNGTAYLFARHRLLAVIVQGAYRRSGRQQRVSNSKKDQVPPPSTAQLHKCLGFPCSGVPTIIPNTNSDRHSVIPPSASYLLLPWVLPRLLVRGAPYSVRITWPRESVCCLWSVFPAGI